jgi:hypothetical protein
MRTRIVRVLGWLLLGLGASVAAAQTTASPAVPPPSPAPFADADALVLREDVTVEYQADGRTVQTVQRKVRILTEKGLRQYATESYSYHRRFSTMEVELARVIKPDGSSRPVDAANIRDLPLVDDRQASAIEQDFRRTYIIYAGLELQDILETRVVVRTHDLMGGHYGDFFLFQYENPILYKQVEIRGPRSKPLHYAVRGGRLEFETAPADDGRVLYRWTGRDLPAVVPEAGMVALPGVALRLLVSTFSDWRELSRCGYAGGTGKTDGNEALRQKVDELTAGLSDPHSKILAVFRFVSTEIRYSAPSMDFGALLEPRPAADVLDTKVAVCREKSVLMIAMLHEIGVEATEALINVTRPTDPEVPSVFFERAVCGVKLPDGRTVFMDPTLGLSTSFGEPYVGDREVLLLTAAGADLARAPHSPASRSRGHVQASSRLEANGDLTSEIRIEGSGYYDFMMRTIGRQAEGLRFAQLWQQLATAFQSGARVQDLQVSPPADLAVPYVIRFRLTAPDYGFGVDRFILFKMPLSTNFFEPYSLGLPRLGELETRRYPLFLFSTLSVAQEERLEIPAGYRVLAVPDPVELDPGTLGLRLTVRREGQDLVFRGEYRCESAFVSPEEYPEFRKLLQRWERFRRSAVVLERQAEPGGKS